MRGLTCRTVSAVPYLISKSSWVLPNGRLRPNNSPRRSFRSSQKLLSADTSTPTLDTPRDHSINSLPESSKGLSNDIPEQRTAGGGDPKPAKPVDKAHYGSASRRAGRHIKRPIDIPPCHLPKRFLDRNVIIGYRKATDEAVAATSAGEAASDTLKAHWPRPLLNAFLAETQAVRNLMKAYPYVWREISTTVRASLEPPIRSHSDAPILAKQHLVLHCPQQGSTHTLDALIRALVGRYSADLIKIDAHDIAEIGGEYLDEVGVPPNESLSTLSYDIHAGLDERYSMMQGLPSDGKTGLGEEEESNSHQQSPVVKTFTLQSISDLFTGKSKTSPDQPAANQAVIQNDAKQLKLEAFVDALLHACSTKRVMQNVQVDETNTKDSTHRSPEHREINQDPASPTIVPPVIIQVDDYPEIYNTSNGGRVLDALHDALYERRMEGQRMLLIGTCEAKDIQIYASRPEHAGQSSESDTGPTKTIIVPASEEMKRKFETDHVDRTKSINARHLQYMIRRLAPNPERVSALVSDTNPSINYSKDRVLSVDQVDRLATLVIGCMMLQDKNMSSEHLRNAITIATESNKAKNEWISAENKKEQQRQKSDKEQSEDISKKGMSSVALQAKLRSQCNKYEERLLPRVVDPSSIQTTFADVRAPKETIETLKTLTSLSLLRPDAFTYGVLATDKITGVLLYGPPGTGKTLLARAVAKESGARVLEVSGADINAMWVGEGEKNVRALFSLAKKLTPCVVFIDEADAMLGSRGGVNNRASHRELINQFLREWDGMGELSAFIMVATNRPFDLDEATLRRLPRRMLVDLPTENDREAILKIHTKDETLDSEVSLQKLAAETPLYSGSDLKNLCVAAALACVKEDYDADIASSSSAVAPVTAPLVLQASTTGGEAKGLAQERSSIPSQESSSQPLARPSSPDISSTLSEALANASSSSNSLSECLSSVSRLIPPLQDSSDPLIHKTLSNSTDPDLSPGTPPADASLKTPASSEVSSQASTRSDLDTSKTSSASTEAKAPTLRRILRRRHFERALEEISASINEDMRSLTQIRKFDEKYGDRRARKGKMGGRYGFGTLTGKEREKSGESAARVRLGQPA
ncbi:MAG: hypothetical protein Q9168_002477 [Polycauliona sp. 1 TL-2023]